MSFDEVVIAWFVTGTTTATLPVKMYSSIQWEVSPVLAAVSTLLTLTSLLIGFVTYRLQSREQPPA
jgi:putative spermidine/putrescine transport system permease protein